MCWECTNHWRMRVWLHFYIVLALHIKLTSATQTHLWLIYSLWNLLTMSKFSYLPFQVRVVCFVLLLLLCIFYENLCHKHSDSIMVLSLWSSTIPVKRSSQSSQMDARDASEFSTALESTQQKNTCKQYTQHKRHSIGTPSRQAVPYQCTYHNCRIYTIQGSENTRR